jgi:hypothetical protein
MSEALSLAFKGSKNHRKRIRLTRRTRQMLKMGLRQPPPRCEPSQTRYQRFHATKTQGGHHVCGGEAMADLQDAKADL